MPTVMPVSELQRNFKKVVDECERSSDPIYLTRNGSASLVVMDAAAFDREMAIHERVRDREIRVQKSIERGYEDIVEKLRGLGADIKRVEKPAGVLRQAAL